MILFTIINKKKEASKNIYSHSMYTKITITKKFYFFSLHSVKNKYEIIIKKNEPIAIVQSPQNDY